MFQIDVTDRWHTTFPGGHVGILLVGNVDNSPRITPLDQRKRAIESHLRLTFAEFSRTDLLELAVLQAYRTYYYGQDVRTPISPNTRRALYVAYAPTGIPRAMVQQQLDSIHENILLAAPEAEVEMIEVFSATAR